MFSFGWFLAVYTKGSYICWIRTGALCIALCVYCEPWLVWIQECEELIRDTERLNSLKSKTLQPKHTEALCCWGQLFVFPQLLSETSHSSHQREPCFPAVMHYGGDERGPIVAREAWSPPSSVLFTLQQLSSTSSTSFSGQNWTYQGWGSGSVSWPLIRSLCSEHTWTLNVHV